MKASYHGYRISPPFGADPKHEIWIGLQPRGQDLQGVLRELMSEIALAVEEGLDLPGPFPIPETIAELRAVVVAAHLDLADDGSARSHWFLLRW